MLKKRVITAIVLALIVLIDVFLLESFYVALLLALILFASVLELVNMTISQKPAVKWLLAALVVGLFFLLLPDIGIRQIFLLSFIGLLAWLMVLLGLFRYHFSGHWSLSSRSLMAMLYLSLLWICIHGLVFMHQHFEQGSWMLMYLLSLVWVADIGAYFSGKRFGRHKLAPGISPGKTREGVVGGLLLNVAWISLVFQLSQGWGLDYVPFLMLGVVTSLISVVGDLLESILKREAGLKDSSHILPGHGGVLDRIDSVIAATPVYLTGLYALGAV